MEDNVLLYVMLQVVKNVFFNVLELWERIIPISGQTMANTGPKCKPLLVFYLLAGL